ncbi:uncharacterized protein si:dkey-9i23.6 isoform X1 [Oncorhynchus keta]|uniref:uncharacterized protein si:dkey-9i23.6 isoform X3 n=1 Tax=Oncorhynchus keta TaxID=8018 RepID=UPI0015F83B48|nr:uncharacterized protein si:dkey-9i23.6 isoform X3 [Oncorhynchus keta]XP_052320565.1 uncharacterized protein si:dkey-9i23.6 isoform X1 [Oncorhynchus keta]XP_052320566.1 uncharacterized protein si:dkey-9i23.6 isoform X2 [Oncorhynchus keta]XP_052320567.1 uncharacterized protein si:dkey-9i23.6 isoform X1 [Oncorhynchus keta]
MSEADSHSGSISLIQSMLLRLSTAEDTDQPPNIHPNTHRNTHPNTPQHLRTSVETDRGFYVTPQDHNNAELIFQGKLVSVIEDDDNGDHVHDDNDPQLEVLTERDNDLESSDRDSEEREEGNSGILFLDAGSKKLVDEEKEETSEPPAVVPRWERRQLLPCPPGLDARPPPPPVPPKRKAKPPLHPTGPPPPPPPPALDPSQSVPVLGRVVGEGAGCELRPTGHGRGPGGQEEDVLSSSGDRLSMYSAVILKSERRFSQPLLDPTLDSTAQRGGGVQQLETTVSVATQDPSQLRGKDIGRPPKASEPVGMGVMGVPKPLESIAPKPLIPKPPHGNRSLPQGPERRAQGSPDGGASSGSETRDIPPDLQSIPPETEGVREPPEPSEHIADGSESPRTPAEFRCNTEEGGLMEGGRNLEGTHEVVDQDAATWGGGGVLGSKHPNIKTMKGGKVKKFAKKMMSRWKQSREEKRGNGEIQEDDGEKEVESERPLVNLRQDRHSVRLHTNMSVIEEEEDEEEKRSSEAAPPTMEPPSQAETERKPVGQRARFQSSFSSFKFNFSPISLVDEILTGEEWSPFLSIKDSPAPLLSVYQSEAASQHGGDKGDQLKTEPEFRLPNDVQHNHEDIGHSLYEDVHFSQSSSKEIVDNQSDNRQQEVDNNNDTGADAIAVIKPKILLDNDAAEESELDHSRPISKDIHDSKSPIRNQSKDHLDFSCVKSLGVLDSSAQKHKIHLSKKRKHRLPGLKTRKTFKIRRTAIKAPEIKFLKPSPPPTLSPTSLPSSSSSCSSPSYVFPSSVFYSIPPSAEEHDPGTTPTQGNFSVKTTESSRKPDSSPKPPLSKFMTVLRDKTKRKIK